MSNMNITHSSVVNSNRCDAILAIITADYATRERVCGGECPVNTASEWADTSLAVEEISAYIDAECFDVDKTVELHTFGVSPSDAAKRLCGHTETIGYRVSSRDLSGPDALHMVLCDSLPANLTAVDLHGEWMVEDENGGGVWSPDEPATSGVAAIVACHNAPMSGTWQS